MPSRPPSHKQVCPEKGTVVRYALDWGHQVAIMISMSSQVRRRAFSMRVVLAVLLGALILLGSGFAYRSQADRLRHYAGSASLPPGTLSQLPLAIGGWTGRDMSMDTRVVEKTDADQLLNRIYDRAGTRQSVNLFVAYGVRFRDLLPHRPELCYPRAGWTLLDKKPLEIPLRSGRTLSCRILRFRQGGLASREIAVLNYYIINDQCWPDVEMLRRHAAGVEGETRYVAQVQIACDPFGMWAEVEETLAGFAAEATPSVIDLLSQALKAAESQPSPSKRD